MLPGDAQLGAQILQHAVSRARLPARPLADRDVLDLRHHLEGHEHRSRLGQDRGDVGLKLPEPVDVTEEVARLNNDVAVVVAFRLARATT
jgi:hypothetical protein